jgi:Tol biopolymer transport system component
MARISPDGSKVAVDMFQSTRGIWVHDLRKPKSLLLVTEPELEAWRPVWTRDDPPRLIFAGTRGGRNALFSRLADASRPPEMLGSFGTAQPAPASWTRDGQLVFLRFTPTLSWDIWALSRDGGSWSSRPLIEAPQQQYDAQMSPDGKWLAYTEQSSSDSISYQTSEQVIVTSFPGLTNRQQLSPEGGRSPVWSRDGRELFYKRGTWAKQDYELVVHNVAADGTISPIAKPLFRLAPMRLRVAAPVPAYDITPDGQRFLFVQEVDLTLMPSPNQIHIIENWFEELKAKVPTGK